MDHPAVIFRFISDGKRRQGMAFREVWVTQVKEVLRAWLAGAGKRPAARRAEADGKPGEEVQLDFGYLGMIGDGDRRRRLHALVFTAVVSRYCFVFLTFSQTAQAVIAGCEAAWVFYGGMFRVLIPDNLKPVVDKADRLEPRWNREWLEYAQARGLVVDPARVRSPQDKG